MNSCQVGYSFQAFRQSIPIATSKLGVFSLSYLPRVVAISIASALLWGGEAGTCVDPRVPGSRLLALLLYIFHNLSSSITINHHNFCCCHFHLINRPPPFTISLPGGPSERPADGLEDQGAQVLERLDGEQVDQTGCPPPGRLGSVNLRRTEEFWHENEIWWGGWWCAETVIHPDSQLSLPLSFHSSEMESNLGKVNNLFCDFWIHLFSYFFQIQV